MTPPPANGGTIPKPSVSIRIHLWKNEAGRDDDARELLRRLQQAHPEFAIPEATREWLETDH